MNITPIVGILGSLILVAGAAYPLEKRVAKHPAHSIKNWLFAVGGLVMLMYAILDYMAGGTIFFVILQLFINSTSILMMFNTPDRFDEIFVPVVGLGMIAWSLTLFEGYNTMFFIIGLAGIGLGYALTTGTFRRNAALTAGSALIALFSYIEQSWIFFWLNIFFALFSAYYAVELWRKKR